MATIAGDVIDVEYTEDASATAPTWTLIAKTNGEITYGSNVNVAETKLHEKLSMEKSATSEAWELAFQKLLETTLASMQTLGLVTSDNRMAGFVESKDPNEQLRITLYEDEAAKAAGDAHWQVIIDDYLLLDSEGTIPADEYATRSFTIYARRRPLYGDALTGGGA